MTDYKQNFFQNNDNEYVEDRGGFLITDLDHYDMLGIERKDCTPKMIYQHYKDRAKIMHPDRGGTQYEFNRLKKAFETLIDPAKKINYDNRFSSNYDSLKKNYVEKDEKVKQTNMTNEYLEKFNKDFEKERRKLRKKQKKMAGKKINNLDDDLQYVLCDDTPTLKKTETVSSLTQKRSNTNVAPLIPHYDRNAFHRYFEEEKGNMQKTSVEDNNDQLILAPESCQGVIQNSIGASGFGDGKMSQSLFSNCMTLGEEKEDENNLQLNITKPLADEKLRQYSSLPDVTQLHSHLEDNYKELIQKKLSQHSVERQMYGSTHQRQDNHINMIY